MTDFLFVSLYGPFVVWQALATAVVLVGAAVITRRTLRRPPVDHPFMGARTCPICGWRGRVTRFDEACPRCARPFTA